MRSCGVGPVAMTVRCGREVKRCASEESSTSVRTKVQAWCEVVSYQQMCMKAILGTLSIGVPVSIDRSITRLPYWIAAFECPQISHNCTTILSLLASGRPYLHLICFIHRSSFRSRLYHNFEPSFSVPIFSLSLYFCKTDSL